MDIETQKIYESYFELFGSAGWKQFVEDLEQSKEDFSNILAIKDAKELHKRQGMIEMLDTIINMPDMMEMAYTNAKEAGYDA